MILLSATFSFLKQGHPLCQYLPGSRPLHIKNYVQATLSGLVKVLLGNNSPVSLGEGKKKNPLHPTGFQGIINVSSILRIGMLPPSLVFHVEDTTPHGKDRTNQHTRNRQETQVLINRQFECCLSLHHSLYCRQYFHKLLPCQQGKRTRFFFFFSGRLVGLLKMLIKTIIVITKC